MYIIQDKLEFHCEYIESVNISYNNGLRDLYERITELWSDHLPVANVSYSIYTTLHYKGWI